MSNEFNHEQPILASPMDDQNENTDMGAEKRTLLSKWAKVMIALFLLIVIVMAVKCIVGRNPSIKLDEYIIVETSGCNGYGSATATINWDGLQSDYGNKLKLTKYAAEKYGRKMQNVNPLDVIRERVSVQLEETQNVSNGDKVAYTWSVDEELDQLVQCSFKYKNSEIKISSLPEMETFNPFDDLTVSFTGLAPYGEASLSYTGSELSISDFVCDQTGNLSVGDTVTVSIDENLAAKCAESLKKIPSVFSQTYTVKGLSRYVETISDISEEGLKILKGQTEDAYRSYTAREWVNGVDLTDLSFVGTYLLTTKDRSYSRYYNVVYIVYKAQVHNHVEATGDQSEKVDRFDKYSDIYWYASYHDLMVGPNGELTGDFLDYYTPDNEFSVESGLTVQKGDFGSWWYKGYPTLDLLYKDAVTSYIDFYYHEESIKK